VTADGKNGLGGGRARHRTRHYRLNQQGQPTRRTRSPRLRVDAWPRGASGRMDGTPELAFRAARSSASGGTVEGGKMTRTLALLLRPRQSGKTNDRSVPRVDRENLKQRDGVDPTADNHPNRKQEMTQ